jgi:hypothetical protein
MYDLDRFNRDNRGPRVEQQAGELARSRGQIHHQAVGAHPQLIGQPCHRVVWITGSTGPVELGYGTEAGGSDTRTGIFPSSYDRKEPAVCQD